jgi:hypothetical protein
MAAPHCPQYWMLISNLHFSSQKIPVAPEDQKHQWDQMVKKIKNIDGPAQLPLFQHDQFFHHVRPGPKRRQECKYREENKYVIGNVIEPCPHGFTGRPLSLYLQ